MNRNAIKIVSGGQTGVDQGALQAARALGLEWGGWVPKGWRTEAGPLDAVYRAKMLEHCSANYRVRTQKNVVDSHATLIITNSYPLTGGTLLTRQLTENAMRSHLVVSLDEPQAVEKVRKWLAYFFENEHPIPFRLNVAGPRESKANGIQRQTAKFLVEVFAGFGIFVDDESDVDEN